VVKPVVFVEVITSVNRICRCDPIGDHRWASSSRIRRRSGTSWERFLASSPMCPGASPVPVHHSRPVPRHGEPVGHGHPPPGGSWGPMEASRSPEPSKSLGRSVEGPCRVHGGPLASPDPVHAVLAGFLRRSTIAPGLRPGSDRRCSQTCSKVTRSPPARNGIKHPRLPEFVGLSDIQCATFLISCEFPAHDPGGL
jgi:hypothetical protein